MYRVEIHNLRLGTVEAGTAFDTAADAEKHAMWANDFARANRLFHMLFRAVYVEA